MGEVYGPLFPVPVLQQTEEGAKLESRLVTMVDQKHAYTLNFWELFRAGLLDVNQQNGVLSYAEHTTISLKELAHLLKAGLIKGIGKVSAKRIIQRFGVNTVKILDEQPEQLLAIEGIGPKRLALIRKNWRLQKSKAAIHFFLKENHIAPNLANPIFQQFRDKGIEMLKHRPYEVALRLKGFTLEDADKIARKQGYPKDHAPRLQAYLKMKIQQFAAKGCSHVPRKQLLKELEPVLKVNTDLLNSQLSALVEKETVAMKMVEVNDEPRQYIVHPPLKQAEEQLLDQLNKLNDQHPQDQPGLKALDTFLVHFNSSLTNAQQAAIKLSISNKFLMVSGSIASGQHQIINGVIDFLNLKGNQYRIITPTPLEAKNFADVSGRKAVPFSELTAKQASTLKIKRLERRGSKVKLVVICHADQLDTFQLLEIIRTIPESSRVLWFGDHRQLPATSGSHPFTDLFDSGRFKNIYLPPLTEQLRQSSLLEKMHEIRRGVFPKLKTNKDADFFFINKEDTEEINRTILKLVKERLPKRYKLNPLKDIQVVSLMENGIIGSNQLNDLLREQLNPSATEIFWKGKVFRKGDKVIQLQDDYQKGILKGEIGQIKRINKFRDTLSVQFSNRFILYQLHELDDLSLAYALPVNHIQRLSTPCVILPVHTSHYPMLFRQALYSTMSKATRLMIMVGTKNAVWIGVKNDKELLRNSGLIKKFGMTHVP